MPDVYVFGLDPYTHPDQRSALTMLITDAIAGSLPCKREAVTVHYLVEMGVQPDNQNVTATVVTGFVNGKPDAPAITGKMKDAVEDALRKGLPDAGDVECYPVVTIPSIAPVPQGMETSGEPNILTPRKSGGVY